MADWWLSSNRTSVQALVSACHNVAPIHQGQCLLREDHDAEQIQLADCWGKWESARWLSFMISVWVIPLLNGFFFSSFKQTMMFVECRYRNGKVTSLHNCCTERETSVLLFINTAFDTVPVNALLVRSSIVIQLPNVSMVQIFYASLNFKKNTLKKVLTLYF